MYNTDKIPIHFKVFKLEGNATIEVSPVTAEVQSGVVYLPLSQLSTYINLGEGAYIVKAYYDGIRVWLSEISIEGVKPFIKILLVSSNSIIVDLETKDVLVKVGNVSSSSKLMSINNTQRVR